MPTHTGEIPSTSVTLLARLRGEGLSREMAWREFHRSYAPVIAGFARRMGARAGEVDDIVQEVLLGFFGAAGEFHYDRTRGRFRGYLKTCAWRKVQTCLARRLANVDPAKIAASVIDARVDAAWDLAWRQAQLQKALEIVRTRYTRRGDQQKTFDAFELTVLLERPAQEVAKTLSMSVDQVHQAKSRVQRALRETMDTLEAFAG